MLNTRRAQFQDRRVRRALTYVFDFETMNRTLFFGLYKRTDSYFEGGELASSGLPEGKELEILNPYRERAAKGGLLGGVQTAGVRGAPATRENLGRAIHLFGEAGWVNQGGKLVNAETGEQFTIEFLGDDPWDDASRPYVENLRTMGIDAPARHRPNQYVNRVNNFDFDSIFTTLSQS